MNEAGHSSLVDAFESACAEHAEADAFAARGATISYRRLERLSRDLAAFLQHRCGLAPGDRIAIQLPNLIEYPVAAWGGLRAGLSLVNTNPLYTERELRHQFQDSGARALVILEDLLPLAERVVPDTAIDTVVVVDPSDRAASRPPPATGPRVRSLPEALAAGADCPAPSAAPSMDDIAVLQYTGGTTGVPKGAILTHGNVFAATRQSTAAFEAVSGDWEINIAPMPLYHIYGFTVNVVSGVLNGRLSVLIPNPRDLDSLIAAMRRFRFTGLTGVNTLFNALLRHPEFDRIDFSHAKVIVAGGTALVEDIANEWERRTGTRIYEGYGLSETSATVGVNTPEARRLGTIGRPMIATETRVVDAQGHTLGPGEEGELLIRGPQVMRGYWQRPEATAEVLDADGWLHTGDVAVIEEDGYVRIVDRIKDMILVSGFNVYPNEIEAVVQTHPDVIECAAIGVPDGATGEAVKLFVVSSNPKLTAAEIEHHCRAALAAYKVPKAVEFRAELPKSNVGKILRRELRQ